jgi:hypothetical protein
VKVVEIVEVEVKVKMVWISSVDVVEEAEVEMGTEGDVIPLMNTMEVVTIIKEVRISLGDMGELQELKELFVHI